MPTSLVLDSSRLLTRKEAEGFQSRQSRLEGPFGESAASATRAFVQRLHANGSLASGLRLRVPFSCLDTPIASDRVSDRSAPELELRPPASRIITSQGAALRLYLTIVAAAHVSTKPGKKYQNTIPLIGDSQLLGWDDLVASPAVPSGRGRNLWMTRDKKARTLRNALENLNRAGLVHLRGDPGTRGRHEQFVVLSDIGLQNTGAPLQYIVPTAREDHFQLPAGFVTKGWLSVLEDSEIVVLLMLACGRHSLQKWDVNFDIQDREVAISGEDRLLYYGIHRDRFATACKTLSWFGLIQVREIDRHPDDGRAEDGAAQLHRIRLVPDAFDEEALGVARDVIRTQLERVAQP